MARIGLGLMALMACAVHAHPDDDTVNLDDITIGMQTCDVSLGWEHLLRPLLLRPTYSTVTLVNGLGQKCDEYCAAEVNNDPKCTNVGLTILEGVEGQHDLEGLDADEMLEVLANTTVLIDESQGSRDGLLYCVRSTELCPPRSVDGEELYSRVGCSRSCSRAATSCRESASVVAYPAAWAAWFMQGAAMLYEGKAANCTDQVPTT